MKANYFVMLFLFFAIPRAQAQFVTVPDPVFANWISSKAPGCIIGNQLDTTCVGLLSIKQALLSDSGIYDLSGISYLDSLEGLNCSRNFLTSLPPLPATLEVLFCNSNLLTQLPDLPIGLKYLYCDSNQLIAVPLLPPNLEYLQCSHNQLTQVPPLPPNLRVFGCYDNLLTQLPPLGDSLRLMGCSNNQIQFIPNFGVSMEYIDCSQNQLTSFPALPPKLYQLRCADNYLTQLPAIPNTIRYIDCKNNLLTSLPDITSPGLTLACADNFLTSLPLFSGVVNEIKFERNLITDIQGLPPKIPVLNLSENPISDLTGLSDSISSLFLIGCKNLECFPPDKYVKFLYWSGSGINCFRDKLNIVTAYPFIDRSFFCNEYVPGACEINRNINGRVVWDHNANCVADSFETGCPLVKVYLDSAGYTIGQVLTDSNGYYFFGRDTGSYKVHIDSVDSRFRISCSANTAYQAIVDFGNPTNDNLDFLVTCPPGFDIGVESLHLPDGNIQLGVEKRVQVRVGDLSGLLNLNCNSALSGQVKIVVRGPMHFAESNVSGQIINDTMVYSSVNFSSAPSGTVFNVNIAFDPEADEGEEVCLEVYVEQISGDLNFGNNYLQYCFLIKDQSNENRKEVSPVSVIDTSEFWLNYTLYFQNQTGDTLENLQLRDGISYRLNPESFEYVGSSHSPIVRVDGNVIWFTFQEINLPDYLTDPENSKGFVKFRIKRWVGVYIGDKITNTGIYDLNHEDTLITNTTVNTIGVYSGIEELKEYSSDAFVLFPNPVISNQIIHIWFRDVVDQKVTFEIAGIEGRYITSLSAMMNDHVAELMIPPVASGTYFVYLSLAGENYRTKIVVK